MALRSRSRLVAPWPVTEAEAELVAERRFRHSALDAVLAAHAVQHGAEGEDVGFVRTPTAIFRRRENIGRDGRVALSGQLAHLTGAEIRHLHGAVLIDQEIRRLEVVVQQAGVVHLLEALGRLQHRLLRQRLLGRLGQHAAEHHARDGFAEMIGIARLRLVHDHVQGAIFAGRHPLHRHHIGRWRAALAAHHRAVHLHFMHHLPTALHRVGFLRAFIHEIVQWPLLLAG